MKVLSSGQLRALGSAPIAPAKPHRTTHHLKERDDPWHWLRDPGYPQVENEEILAYLNSENEYFAAVMSPHQALRDRLFEETKSRHIEDESSVPVRDGNYLYQWRFEKGAEYRTWWRKPAAGEAPWRCILNEPELAQGHEYFRLGGFDISPDESTIVWSVDTNGAERFSVYLRPMDMDDRDARVINIPEVAETPIFARDGENLVYVVLNQQWRPWQVWVHSLAGKTPDTCIFEESDARFRVQAHLTRSKKHLVISTGDHTTTECLVVPADRPLAAPRLVSARERGCQYDLDHAHGRFYIRINDTHENFRLVSTPESALERGNWREEIAASDDAYLQAISAFDKWLVVSEKADALDQVRIRDYLGAEHRVEFPERLYAAGLGHTPDFAADALRIEYQSLVKPETTFDYFPQARRLETLKVQDVPGYDATRYETRRIWVPVRDGKRVPVSLVSLKGRPMRALHLYAYGAYGIGTPPGFNLARVSLLDRGVGFAIAHIRGGDELGRGWYLDGKLEHRSNTFNDFVDVARHLIDTGEAEPGRIAISGGSAGGELMGAVINQAPELWGAVVAHVPFVDVLNTMLDATLPLTPPEWDEWGNPIEDADAYERIASYCPYTQARAHAYPPMLVTAGLNDPRVTYWEPAKWVAKLRQLKTNNNMLLLKTNMGAGHGGKSGRFERLREKADEQAFFLLALDLA